MKEYPQALHLAAMTTQSQSEQVYYAGDVCYMGAPS